MAGKALEPAKFILIDRIKAVFVYPPLVIVINDPDL